MCCILKVISYSRIKPDGRTPRAYQEELARPAKDGKNCVVCAKTGSGKTMVAMMVVHHHLGQTYPVMVRRAGILKHAHHNCQSGLLIFKIHDLLSL